MKSKFNKVASATRIKFYILVIALNVLFFPTLTKYTNQGCNLYSVSVNNIYVGKTDNIDCIYDYYREARREMASASENVVMTEFPDITYTGESVLYGEIDEASDIIENIKKALNTRQIDQLSHAYAIKVNDELIYVQSAASAQALIQSAVNNYDVNKDFTVSLNSDNNRELSVLYATIEKKETLEAEETSSTKFSAGFEADFSYSEDELISQAEEGFKAYDYGIQSMELSKTVEIVEAYVPTDKIITTEQAISILLEEQEVQQVYKVQAGDTLSEISITVNIPLDELIAMNDALENEYSTINIDQELIITVPEPALTINWVEVARLEEAYNLPVEYVYNDSWYTTKSETLVQPSAGYHEAVLEISHSGQDVTGKETLYEVVITEPVAKVVEVGTIEPPTFIRPLSGGRISSYFGRRNSPTSGASSYHEGIDYYTPIGSSVYASTSGTITRAGWSGGYGYCVDVSQSNGVLTRYAHLSKIYVSVGQYVSQGQVIAASGNTGVSTGPHLHFEIRFNGTAVNPLNYVY